ncbi:MAG: tRNA (N6-isopentenyl adenosine(37)-C2)-methylthiotransferase MiaB [Bacteroidota bacterium]
MYNNNPTLEGVKIDKTILKDRQGEIFFQEATQKKEGQKYFYIESYGCQMNFSDSEIVASILAETGYQATRNYEIADLILINTCSIREKAEETVRKRLRAFDKVKDNNPGTLVGVLGCMAERLKAKFLEEEKLVDLVVGPDAYRDLPKLLANAEDGEKGVNVFLSREETYADISPLRLGTNGVTAFISIMRGCDNMCSFCVVPFTRGRERSRNAFSIVAEATDLYNKGYREVTLLGQNVDSYKWENPENEQVVTFANLLELVAKVHTDLRVRFSTSHPKDITDEVLFTMKKHENICKYIHLPVQSGNSRVLKLMNRTYDREWYINKVNRIYEIMPDCAISSDVIAGFCTETEEEHQETLGMLEFANYSMSYMFYYSERPGTLAAKKYEDDVPLETKKRRLQEIIRLQNQISHHHNQADIGKTFKVLIEGDSKKSDQDFKGRNSQNKMLVFPKKEGLKAGDYTYVKVESATSATLKGKIVEPPKDRSDWPVNFVKKGEDDSNLEYWLTQSPQERMAELEKTRQEINKRLYGDKSN